MIDNDAYRLGNLFNKTQYFNAFFKRSNYHTYIIRNPQSKYIAFTINTLQQQQLLFITTHNQS